MVIKVIFASVCDFLTCLRLCHVNAFCRFRQFYHIACCPPNVQQSVTWDHIHSMDRVVVYETSRCLLSVSASFSLSLSSFSGSCFKPSALVCLATILPCHCPNADGHMPGYAWRYAYVYDDMLYARRRYIWHTMLFTKTMVFAILPKLVYAILLEFTPSKCCLALATYIELGFLSTKPVCSAPVETQRHLQA